MRTIFRLVWLVWRDQPDQSENRNSVISAKVSENGWVKTGPVGQFSPWIKFSSGSRRGKGRGELKRCWRTDDRRRWDTITPLHSLSTLMSFPHRPSFVTEPGVSAMPVADSFESPDCTLMEHAEHRDYPDTPMTAS